MLLPTPDAEPSIEFTSSAKDRGLAALERDEASEASEPAGEAPAAEGAPPTPAAPASPPAEGVDAPVLGVVERVKAALAAKAKDPGSPPAGDPAPTSPVSPPLAEGEPTYTRAQLQESLSGERALDFLIDAGVDVVKHYNLLTDRAGTTVQGRQTDSRLEQLEQRIDAKLAKLEESQTELGQQHTATGQQSAVQQFHRHLGVNAAKYPLLAAESPEEQNRRAVRASQDFVAAGEVETNPELELEAICKLAENSIRERLKRYPGVRLVGGTTGSAVGADGSGSGEPTTLSGSVGSETMPATGAAPMHGQPGWREHMLGRAGALLTGS